MSSFWNGFKEALFFVLPSAKETGEVAGILAAMAIIGTGIVAAFFGLALLVSLAI